MSWVGTYSYTRSINQTGIDDLDRSVGKQLPYVPLHNAVLSSNVLGKSWSIGLSADYTGLRYVTTENESELPDFLLLSANASKSFQSSALSFETYVRLNNLLNTFYQNVKNKAMPGFNFSLGVHVKFNKI